METIMLNASLTTKICKRAFLLLSIALLTTFTSIAQDSAVNTNETVFVNFLKLDNGQVFFTVRYNNDLGRKFDILINDEDGESLYRGYFPGKNFSKVFRAPAELGKLQVTVRGFSGKTEHKFEISSESRVIRETYVTAVSNRQ